MSKTNQPFSVRETDANKPNHLTTCYAKGKTPVEMSPNEFFAAVLADDRVRALPPGRHLLRIIDPTARDTITLHNGIPLWGPFVFLSRVRKLEIAVMSRGETFFT
uniref:Uncharacterized protein n=1 Tax=Sipha flava TaxID=143950 RepID=A0A2S2QWT1_9HEMI